MECFGGGGGAGVGVVRCDTRMSCSVTVCVMSYGMLIQAKE